MRKRLKTILQYSFFLGLGIFLVWWSVKDLTGEDRSHIRTALKNAKYWLIIPVFCVLFLSHYVRARRWRLLIDPLGYKPKQRNVFFAVMIGYLANQAVPRLGEVLKCTVLARYEKVPADKLVGTIILERIIDAVTLLMIFGITIVIQPGIYSQLVDVVFNSTEQTEAKNVSSTLITGIVVGIIVLAIAIWMLDKKKTFKDLFNIGKRIWLSVWQGLSAIQHLKRRWLFIGLTVVLWSLYLAGGYLGFLAFQETSGYGIKEAFTVLSAGSIGMIITPGGIGAYAYLIQKTMQVYGLNEGIALAFGWVLWLAQTVVILIGGLISFVLLPYYNKSQKLESS